MPSYDERGILRQTPMQTQMASVQQAKPRNPMAMVIVASCLVVALTSLGIASVYTYPLLLKRATYAAQGRDIDNMKLIAKALNAYADRYGTYPPSVVKDEKGKPLYSWRVLVLPFLGYQTLYDSFDLNQSHSSANNLNCIAKMPREFASSSSDASLSHSTNYSLLVGPGTLFPATGPHSPAGVDDATILLVETSNSPFEWTAPGDIDVSLGLKPGNVGMKELGGLHPNEFTAVTTQGVGLRIPNSVSGAVLQALISAHGGEKVDVTNFR